MKNALPPVGIVADVGLIDTLASVGAFFSTVRFVVVVELSLAESLT